MGEEIRVFRQLLQMLVAGELQHTHRVAGAFPHGGVEPVPEGIAGMVPAPLQVGSQLVQYRQRWWQLTFKVRHGRRSFPCNGRLNGSVSVHQTHLRQFAPFNMGDIGQGHAGDGSERLAGKKGLVAGDDYIGEGEQACKYVVLQQLVGVVFKK